MVKLTLEQKVEKSFYFINWLRHEMCDLKKGIWDAIIDAEIAQKKGEDPNQILDKLIKGIAPQVRPFWQPNEELEKAFNEWSKIAFC